MPSAFVYHLRTTPKRTKTCWFAAAGQAGFVANMSDIAPRHGGKLFGLCNTFGKSRIHNKIVNSTMHHA